MRHAYNLSLSEIDALPMSEYAALRAYLPVFAPHGYEMLGDDSERTSVSEQVVGDRKVRSIETTDFNEFAKFLRGGQ